MSCVFSLVVVLCSVVALTSAFYERTQVLKLTSPVDIALIEPSQYFWVVELYRSDCPHSQKVRPDYEAFAQKYHRMVRVAAVDLMNANDAAVALEKAFNFKINAVPIFYGFKPKANGKKEMMQYDGARTVAGFSAWVSPLMPDFSDTLTEDTFDLFESKVEQPRVVLFTNKSATPALIKALSTTYKNRVSFGVAHESQKSIVNAFGVKEYPSLYVLPRGVRAADNKAVKFGKSLNHLQVDLFLVEYAVRVKGNDTGLPALDVDKFKLAQVNLNDLQIKQLRLILKRWGDVCATCVNKQDYIDRIEKLRVELGDRDPAETEDYVPTEAPPRRAVAEEQEEDDIIDPSLSCEENLENVKNMYYALLEEHQQLSEQLNTYQQNEL